MTTAKEVIDNIRKEKLDEALRGRRIVITNNGIPQVYETVKIVTKLLRRMVDENRPTHYLNMLNTLTGTRYTVDEFLKEFEEEVRL